LLPGYTIVGIDCDNNPDNIISASGALHCITHSVGVDNPLLISHQPLPDTDDNQNAYVVDAYMNHAQGVTEAFMFWKTDLADDYTEVAMVNTGGSMWSASIPAQPFGTRVYYYVRGHAADGKQLNRPMPAPDGYWDFRVLESVSVNEVSTAAILPVYPNPASAITCVPVSSLRSEEAVIELMDVQGRVVQTLLSGMLPQGDSKYFFDATNLSAGAYVVRLRTASQTIVHRVMVL
ncbi:MAG: hypothetical protein RL226_473, partial [Bacteroidota bacterium]|jgi:hypothetical protein